MSLPKKGSGRVARCPSADSPQEQAASPKENRGRFKRGQDARRHAFTPEERSKGGRKAKRHLLPFKTGFDVHRHVLLPEECAEGGRRGFETIATEKPWMLLWLKKKMKAQGRYRRGGKAVKHA